MKKKILNPNRGGQIQETTDGIKFVDNFENFVNRQNPDGSFDNFSYNRVWKTDGIIGACNCTKIQEILVDDER